MLKTNANSAPASWGGKPAKLTGTVRYAMPKTRVITIDEVPDPPVGSRSRYEHLYAQIVALEPGKALELTFSSASHADYAKSRFKKFLGASRSENGATRYFWIEKV